MENMENIEKELIEIAKKARENAYVPFSHYKVGAALLTKDGIVFTGCNIEDPSAIGVMNVCAERCAVIKAKSEGYHEYDKIAVVGGKTDEDLIHTTPCGVCRQYLNSFSRDIKIITLNGEEIEEFTVEELLPHSFSEKFGEH